MRLARLRQPMGLGAILALLFLFPAGAGAQTETGQIEGVVTDPQDAIVKDATVTVTSLAGQAHRQAVTDPSGRYFIAALKPGPYLIKVEATGFAPVERRIQLTVGQRAGIDVKLELGRQEETLVVSAESIAVNTQTQEVSTVITEEQIRELPTVTRDPYDLVVLSGNISQYDNNQDDNITKRGTGFTLNGQRTASTNVLLDGSNNNNEYFASLGQTIPLDAVQEFSVITSNFGPEYGRASGGIVNVVTKSGSNEYHGTVYEFYRGSSLASNHFSSNANELERPDYKRHQFGFSLGGPVKKDKLHFFVSLEHIRVRSSAEDIFLVPTPELLAASAPATQDFFSGYSLAPEAAEVGIITAGEVTDETGGLSAFDPSFPAFRQIRKGIALDVGGGLPQNTHLILGRLDWNVSANTSAYLRYAFQREDDLVGSNSYSPYAGFDTGNLDLNSNFLASVTHVFSPRLTGQTKLVYMRLKNEQPLGEQPSGPTLYAQSNAVGAVQGYNLAFPGYLPFSPSAGVPAGGPQRQYHFYQDFNLLRGKHDFRVGGSFFRIEDDQFFAAFLNSVETLGADVGSALDNLVAGQLLQFQSAVFPQGKFPGDTLTLPVGPPQFTRNNRYNEWALYANDSWSVRPNLKLNLGLRYEYFGVQHNTDPRLDSNFYYGQGATEQERIRNGNVFIAPDSPAGGLWRPDRNNFAPRIGFAWDVNGDGRTSVRGGYGIGYERNFGNITFNVIQNPPAYAVVSISPADVGGNLPITRDNAGPLAGTGTKVLPATSLRWVDENIKTAYAHFWSLSLQRQLNQKTVVGVDYTGSAGEKLYSLEDPNRRGSGAIFDNDPSQPLRRLNMQYTNLNRRGNGGYSRHHGLTLGLESRDLGVKGLSVTGHYTLASSKDNLSTTFSEAGNNFDLGLLDPYNPELDFGYADYDVRHRLVLGGSWEVPFWADTTGTKKQLLDGWRLNYIFTAQSGYPFTIWDCANAFFICNRMIQVADPSKTTGASNPIADTPNRFNYLDLTNQQPGYGTYAHPIAGISDVGPYPANMSKRNSFRGPGNWNLDLSVSKLFKLDDRKSIQLRLEAFNVFNHANLFVNGSEAEASVGYIPAFKDGHRDVQLGAKFLF